MLTKEQLSEIRNKASQFKESWNSEFWTCFAYTMPQRNYIWRTKGLPGNMKQIPLYTTAGRDGTSMFLSRIQSKLTPFGKDWIRFVPKDSISDDYKQELQDVLDQMSKRANEYKNDIGLDIILNESYHDLIAGTACIVRQDTAFGLQYENIPLIDISLDTEKKQSVVRNWSQKLGTVQISFPELRGKKKIGNQFLTDDNSTKDIKLSDVTYFNTQTQLYEYYLCEDGSNDIILTRNYKRSPFKIMHWDRPSDMPFGDGVGLKALPALKRLNSYIKSHLEILPFSFPMFIAKNGALFDRNLTFKPGGFIWTNGQPTDVIPLKMQQQITDFKLEMQKEELEIKSIMLSSTLPNDPSQMTAAEVYARTNPQTDVINNSTYQLTDVIKDIALDIAEFLHKTELVPAGFSMSWKDFSSLFEPKIGNGSDIDADFIQKIQAYIGTVGQIDPQAIYQTLKRSKMLEKLESSFGLPQDIISTESEIEEASQAVAEAQGQLAQAQLESQMALDENKESAIAQREVIKKEA